MPETLILFIANKFDVEFYSDFSQLKYVFAELTTKKGVENIDKVIKMGGDAKSIIATVGPCISQESYEVKQDFYLEFKDNVENSDSFFIWKKNGLLFFDLRAFVTKKLNKNGVLHVDNINLDSFTMTDEYFSHRRAKKLGENDYGRCISVIMKTNTQN